MKKTNNSRPRGHPIEEGRVHTASWRAKTEDVTDRLNTLRETWISVRVWRPAWRQYVGAVGKLMRPWPGALAKWAGAISPEQVKHISWAEVPRVDPPRPTDEALERVGLTLKQWRAQLEAPPPAIIRHLLEELSGALEAPTERLAAVLIPPPLQKLPPSPKTSAAARKQWLEARTAYTRQRLAVRKGHRRRAELEDDLKKAIVQARTAWLNLWPFVALRSVGSERAALKEARQLRRAILSQLEKLDESGAGIEDFVDEPRARRAASAKTPHDSREGKRTPQTRKK